MDSIIVTCCLVACLVYIYYQEQNKTIVPMFSGGQRLRNNFPVVSSLQNHNHTLNETSIVTMISSNNYVSQLKLWYESLRGTGYRGTISVVLTNDVNISNSMVAKIGLQNIYRVQKLSNLTNNMKNKKKMQQCIYKYKLWELPFKKIIYYDVDVVFLKPVSDAFRLCQAALCATIDFGPARYASYFNAGFMVLQPSKNIAQKIKDYFISAEPSNLAEQDWLNYALSFTHVVLLPPIYNVQRGCRELAAEFNSVVKVCHCTGHAHDKLKCMKQIWDEI